jgi:hypothetical protein
MKKTISTELSQANIERVKHLLADTPLRLATLSAEVAAERVRHPLGAGERSFTETVAHLLHCEARSAEAILLALLTDEPLLPDVHAERQWGKLVRLEQYEVIELLGYFAFRRKLLLGVLHEATDSGWQRTVREVGKQRQESVYWIARALALHEQEHMTDLERKLKPHG